MNKTTQTMSRTPILDRVNARVSGRLSLPMGATEPKACDACGYTIEDGHCECDLDDDDREQAMREHMADGRAEMGGAW